MESVEQPVSPGSKSAMAVISTAPFHGYQVVFSPYSPNKLAFVGAQNYGIAGEHIDQGNAGIYTARL